MRTLVGASYSPWSQKARWALDHYGVTYRWQSYLPTYSEIRLRYRLKRWRGRVTVPVLIDGKQTFEQSRAIADRAHRIGEGPTLFPSADVDHWDQLSEAALAEGRQRVTEAILANPAAKREALDGVVPKSLQPALQCVASFAAQRVLRKYRDKVQQGALDRTLSAIRKQLERTKNDYLLGTFSYADIAMAVVLEMVDPVANDYVFRAPATRACWRDESRAIQYKDLLDWRNRICERHRQTRHQRKAAIVRED